MSRYKIDFQPETHCDYCNEFVHNHFDCPVCNTKSASTSIYGEYWDVDEFECEKCKAKFRRVYEEDGSSNDLWESV